MGVNQAQTYVASQIGFAFKYLHAIQASAAPFIKWAKNPKGLFEIFIIKRSKTSERFSKLTSVPIEFLAIVQKFVR